MNKWLFSFFIFVLLGGFTILRSMGLSIFIGYILGIGILHIGISKKRIFLILLGVIITIFSFFVPIFLGVLFQL